MPYALLSPQTQALYAELVERLLTFATHRSIGQASGCFTAKTVKGVAYGYFQYSDLRGGQKQVYLGRKTPELDKTIDQFLKSREAAKDEEEKLQRLCSQLRAGGAITVDTVSARVLRALADGAFFHFEGVLVGTHAFAVIGNMLGVHWKGASLKTQDIDIAGDPLQLAVTDSDSDVPRILESIQMGFVPIPSLNPKHPSTSFAVRGNDLRVDVLTPEIGAPKRKPVHIKRFNVAAQPLRFLDYLIQDPQPAAVVDGEGILVKVPQPARFALHKLITAQERASAMHTKSEKDLFQAAQVLSFLCDARPGDIRQAWDELKKRGSGWTKRVVASLKRIKKTDEETYSKLLELIPKVMG